MDHDRRNEDEFMRDILDHISRELGMDKHEVLDNLNEMAHEISHEVKKEKICGRCDFRDVCSRLEKTIRDTKENLTLRDVIKATPGMNFEEARKDSIRIANQIMSSLIAYKDTCFYGNVANFLNENISMILTTKNIDSIFCGRAFIMKIQTKIDQELVNDVAEY
jgi:hypothetical protein